MESDAECWLELAKRLGIEVIAPFDLELSGARLRFTALLPQFGTALGMLVDSNSELLWPHRTSLLAAGYGFSCVGCSDSAELKSAHEMLSDWGWTSKLPSPDRLLT